MTIIAMTPTESGKEWMEDAIKKSCELVPVDEQAEAFKAIKRQQFHLVEWRNPSTGRWHPFDAGWGVFPESTIRLKP